MGVERVESREEEREREKRGEREREREREKQEQASRDHRVHARVSNLHCTISMDQLIEQHPCVVNSNSK